MSGHDDDRAVVRSMAQLGAGYGRSMAILAAAGEAFNRALAESFAQTRAALEGRRVDPEQASVRRYERAVRREREAGLRHVRAEAARVRRELGLRP